ncbi:MAG TPA: DUF4328 domain-containing protein [Pilimelia sp.]|nr:DUF4328 domain-containing protein [Pilimelia sp.]
MQCPTCGETVTGRECITCGTPAGGPVVWPGVRTRSVHAVGTAAVVAVAVVVLVDIITALFPWYALPLAERARDTGDRAVLDPAYAGELALFVAYCGSYVVAAVLVIVWLYRARANLEAFPGATPSLSESWAAASWFLPFANMVIPCLVMNGVARSSLLRTRTGVLVGIWWGAYLLTGLFSNLGGGLIEGIYDTPPADSSVSLQRYVDHYGSAIPGNVTGSVLLVIAGVMLSVLILRISRAQEERLARAATWQPVPPDPAGGPGDGLRRAGDATIGP